MKKTATLLYVLLMSGICFGQSHLQWTTTERTPDAQINDLRHMGTDKAGNTYFIDFTQSNISFM